MKKQSLLVVMVIMLGASIPTFSQDELSDYLVEKSNSNGGEFQIGVQDFNMSFYGGRVYTSFSPRIGYMMTNKDMVFASVNFSGLSGIEMYSIETSLNYRRYFGSLPLKPFAQLGVGYGYFRFPDNLYFSEKEGNYFYTNTGAGISYKYKRWSFELGMQLIYNQKNNNEVHLKPLGGVSFSF